MEKENRDLDLQRKMTKHYALRNQIARAKLKRALAKVQAHKEEKVKKSLTFLLMLPCKHPKHNKEDNCKFWELFRNFGFLLIWRTKGAAPLVLCFSQGILRI